MLFPLISAPTKAPAEVVRGKVARFGALPNSAFVHFMLEDDPVAYHFNSELAVGMMAERVCLTRPGDDVEFQRFGRNEGSGQMVKAFKNATIEATRLPAPPN